MYCLLSKYGKDYNAKALCQIIGSLELLLKRNYKVCENAENLSKPVYAGKP